MARLKRPTLQEKALLPAPMDIASRIRVLIVHFRHKTVAKTEAIIIGPELLGLARQERLTMEFLNGDVSLGGFKVTTNPSFSRYEMAAA